MDSYTDNLISINDLCFSLDNRELIHSLSFEVGPCRRVGVTGPSGCGKTTLLRSILNKKTPPNSTYSRFAISNEQFGYVPQRNGLFPWYSLQKNLRLAVQASRNIAKEANPVDIDTLLTSYGLSNVAANFPDQLSGGEYQRAALATAIAFQSRLILADEPLTGVDNNIKWNVLEALTANLAEQRTSLLLVSHDVDTLVFLCDEVILLGEVPARQIELLSIPNHHPRTRSDMISDEFKQIREHLFELLVKITP